MAQIFIYSAAVALALTILAIRTLANAAVVLGAVIVLLAPVGMASQHGPGCLLWLAAASFFVSALLFGVTVFMSHPFSGG